uniref:hypothetical protein n=1 Tax=Candidatus Puniceispirillum sp. TaxID=2026719 RepID=UPI003F69A948
FKISVYEIQQADLYKSQRTTRYHVPPPANLFQNASNFFKQRLPISAWLGNSYVGRTGSTKAGYMQVSATCPPLKCDFVNFFAKTPFFLDYQSENRPLKTVSTDLFCGIFINKFIYIRLKQTKGEKTTQHIYLYHYVLFRGDLTSFMPQT